MSIVIRSLDTDRAIPDMDDETRAGSGKDLREEKRIMWACYIGEISGSYRERWEPHTVSPDQEKPDIYDVLVEDSRIYIMYRLGVAAYKCFSDPIQVDWGGWAYKVTKAQAIEYNRMSVEADRIKQEVIDGMEDGKVYGIIDVEIY